MDKTQLVKTWRKAGFKLELYDLSRRDSYGKWILGYKFYDGRTLVFYGDDFHNSPMYAIDSIDTVYALLGFLSLGSDDVENEYFDTYTPDQIAWRDSSRRDDLSNLIPY